MWTDLQGYKRRDIDDSALMLLLESWKPGDGRPSSLSLPQAWLSQGLLRPEPVCLASPEQLGGLASWLGFSVSYPHVILTTNPPLFEEP